MHQMTIKRRDALKGLLAGGSSLALSGCMQPGLATALTNSTAADTLDAIAWRLLGHYPETATSLGIDKGERAALRSQLSDRSPEGQARLAATLREDLNVVRSIDTKNLKPATRTSIEVVRSAYATGLEGLALPYGDVAVGGWRNAPYVVIQNVGAYLDIPRFLDAEHPVRSAQDAEAYLARLEAMPGQLAGEMERVRSAAGFGVIPPDFLLDNAIPQLERSLKDAMAGGALVKSLARRTRDIPGGWNTRASKIVKQLVAPALEAQLAELFRQRRRAKGDPGMQTRPRGDEWYAWALQASTTTTMDADEVHARGREELANLQARIEPILQSLDYTQGTIGERMAGLSTDPRFKFADGDKGRAEIMAFIRKRIDWIKAQMPRAFRSLASGNVEVRRLPPAEEPGAPSAYGGGGSIDGMVPGKMWINLRTTDLHRKYDLPTLVHHEAIPGHVWQHEYANRLPLIRSILAFNAYSEGWALYSEQLADELGAYDGDPVGQLGYLQNQAWRAARLVVDTGLHAKGWSRERAIAYFRREVGLSLAEVTSEVDRYCAWPGQACGYMVGRLRILDEREKVKVAMRDAYDVRDFNQAIVDGGNVPLDVLGLNIARYIAR